jgi:hypothetical protein
MSIHESFSEPKKFTRAQRREMQKLTARVDRVTQADRRYFERFPARRHRVRLASQAELAQHEIMCGPPFMVPGCRFFVAVRKISPDVRMRLFLRGVEGAEIDLDEATALAVFESATTEQSRQIEAAMREYVRARG